MTSRQRAEPGGTEMKAHTMTAGTTAVDFPCLSSIKSKTRHNSVELKPMLLHRMTR